MLNLVRFSFARIIRSKEFMIILFLCFVISIIIPLYLYGTASFFAEIGSFYDALYQNNINELPLILLIYLSPILSGVLTSEIVHDEKKLQSVLYTRKNRLSVYMTAVFVCFVIGFLLMLVMNILICIYTYCMIGIGNDTNVYINSCLFPMFNFDHLHELFMFADDLIQNPMLRCCIYILLFSIFNGVLYMFSYSINFYVNNKYIGYILPFFIISGVMMVSQTIGSEYYLQRIIDPQLGVTSSSIIYITFIAMILISIGLGIFYHKWKER